MELDWLETFLAVADRGGFTAASEHIHRSQSRVSAHIAGLERELGVQLVDRTRRPAALTPAGQVLARHAREIVSGIASARSAVGALQSLEQEQVSVLTTPCIGSALFPGVLAAMSEAHPAVSVALSERCWHDVEARFTADGVAVAVLPTLPRPLAPGLRERLLWREPIRLVLPSDHPLIADAEVKPERLADLPLVITGGSPDCGPELLPLLARRGIVVRPLVAVDTPQTVVAMVRAGVGIGVVNAVALEPLDTSDLAVRDIADPDMVREVAAYWYDALVTTAIGQALLRSVLAAAVPPGATPSGRQPVAPLLRR